MELKDFDYALPKELIAQEPLSRRDQSRLLVLNRDSHSLDDKHFYNLSDYLSSGDVLVLNDTKVFPARIVGKKKRTEGKVELLLLGPYQRSRLGRSDEMMSAAEAEEMDQKKIWRCLLQPSLKEGQEIYFSNSGAEAIYLKRDDDFIPLVEFRNIDDVRAFAHCTGTMPLPPYIKRDADRHDETVYQTVYADKEGAVAAPTAGLHFTKELITSITEKGVVVQRITLHVGYGTFKPVEDIENHQIHSECFELSDGVAQAINQAKAKKKKIWAVGTTSARVLETCVKEGHVISGKGMTNLYIKEPFTFEVVDGLITNFHLPKTTLLLLVSAFAGEKLRKMAYEHAVRNKYRFYSYGDAMLVV